MLLAACVGLAAAAGAVSRYLLDRALPHRPPQGLPWGTFLINVTGSLLLGLVTGLAAHHGLSANVAAVLGVGFAGGYTTWSTLTWETVALARDGNPTGAVLTVAGSLAVGLAAGALGFALALL